MPRPAQEESKNGRTFLKFGEVWLTNDECCFPGNAQNIGEICTKFHSDGLSFDFLNKVFQAFINGGCKRINLQLEHLTDILITHERNHVRTAGCCIRMIVKSGDNWRTRVREANLRIEENDWKMDLRPPLDKNYALNAFHQMLLQERSNVRRWSKNKFGINWNEITDEKKTELEEVITGDSSAVMSLIKGLATNGDMNNMAKIPHILQVREYYQKLNPNLPIWNGWSYPKHLLQRFQDYTQKIEDFYNNMDRFRMGDLELKKFFDLEHNWIQLAKLKHWILTYLFTEQKFDRYKGLMIYSPVRGTGKTLFVASLVNFEKEYYAYNRNTFSQQAFQSKPGAKFVFADDMEFQKDWNLETWKGLVVGQENMIRCCGSQFKFEGGIPMIINTNRPNFFAKFVTDSAFNQECTFIQLKESLSPPGFERKQDDPNFGIQQSEFAGLKFDRKKRFQTSFFMRKSTDPEDEAETELLKAEEICQAEKAEFEKWKSELMKGNAYSDENFKNARDLISCLQGFAQDLIYTQSVPLHPDEDELGLEQIDQESEKLNQLRKNSAKNLFGKRSWRPQVRANGHIGGEDESNNQDEDESSPNPKKKRIHFHGSEGIMFSQDDVYKLKNI
jgi:hypothetical protein